MLKELQIALYYDDAFDDKKVLKLAQKLSWAVQDRDETFFVITSARLKKMAGEATANAIEAIRKNTFG